jgi:PAS domain-containing protein
MTTWPTPRDEAFVGISLAGEAVYESVKSSNEIPWSPSYYSLKHYAPSVTCGMRVGDNVVLCDLNRRRRHAFSRFRIAFRQSFFVRSMKAELPGPMHECRIVRKNGELRLVEWTITANYDAKGTQSGVTGMGTDIAEAREQRKHIESSLAEKEVLLRAESHKVDSPRPRNAV